MRPVLVAVVTGALLGACTRPAAGFDPQGWSPVPNRYARHFAVWQRGADRLVCVFADTAQRDTIGVYRFSEAGRTGTHFARALHRVVLGSTTHVPFMAALNELGAVAGCAHVAEVRDSLARAAFAKAGVQEVIGGDGLDRERILAMHPEAVLAYPFGRQENDRLAQLGIPVIEVAEYQEAHPLGKAEWIRFFGTLLGREREADSIFHAIAGRYEAVRGAVPADRPTVFFGSTFQAQWFVPPGNSYMACLIADAGGRYLFADERGPGNITLDAERTVGYGAKAAVWGTILALPHDVTERDIAGGDTRILALPAFQAHRTFYGNSAQSDLFGEAALHPDVLLMDLRAILHPPSGASEGRYFRMPVQNGTPIRR